MVPSPTLMDLGNCLSISYGRVGSFLINSCMYFYSMVVSQFNYSDPYFCTARQFPVRINFLIFIQISLIPPLPLFKVLRVSVLPSMQWDS